MKNKGYEKFWRPNKVYYDRIIIPFLRNCPPNPPLLGRICWFAFVLWCGFVGILQYFFNLCTCITSFGGCTRPQHPETFKGVFDQFTVSPEIRMKLRAKHAKTLTLNIVGPTMLGVVASVPNNTLSRQHATDRVCKRTQHVTSNNVGSSARCWPTILRRYARGLIK